MEADAALLAQAGSLSAGVLAEAAAGGGALRAFTFSVDLRRFVAGPRLPLNLASVALELDLPTELAGGCWQWRQELLQLNSRGCVGSTCACAAGPLLLQLPRLLIHPPILPRPLQASYRPATAACRHG